MRKKNIALLGIASLAMTALVGGTWAVWTQELKAGNEFRTAYYSTKLEEKFQSPDNWQPGVETEKNVWLSNPGEIPVLTKAVVSQRWMRRENVLAVTEPGAQPVPVPPLKGETYKELTFGENDEYAAVINFNQQGVAILRQGIAARDAGEVSRLGIPIVDSISQAKGRWLLTSETPDENGDWTFYYIGVVNPGTETPHLIESVTMNPHAGNTVLGKKTYYVKKESGYEQVTVDLVNPETGYDSANYTLTVSMTTVQATKAAVEEIFKTDGTQQVVVNYLASEIADTGIYTAEGDKRLLFDETNGVIGYTHKGAGSKTEDGNWFMSFTNMTPGSTYVDEMTIENHSRKNFDIFMKIEPRQQSALQDELLNMISMKIFYNNQKIYEGKATGAIDPAGNLMQTERPLGYYGAGSSGRIRVEMQLDPSLALEKDADGNYYSRFDNVLSKIDWKFMVQERVRPSGGDGGGSGDDYYDDPGSNVTITPGGVPAGDGPMLVTIDGEEVPLAFIPDEEVPLIGALPQTGDEQPIMLLLMVMAASAGMMIFLFIRRRRRTSEESR